MTHAPPTNARHGLLIVDKPSGPTSHDVVAQARRLFGTRGIGHAGTLDPMASGVLLVLVGEATKLSASLTLESKSYLATVRFGTATDSDDAQGTPLSTVTLEPGWLTSSRLEHALDLERNRTEQVPPCVSAIKQGGVTAYKRHRRGEAVELAARQVKVDTLTLLDRTETSITLSLAVSKGYYVRALARDLGAALGVPAHLAQLRRTSSGCFRIDEATAWPCTEVPSLLSLVDVARRVLPIRRLLPDGVRRARQGQMLTLANDFEELAPASARETDRVEAWLDTADTLVALGKLEPDGTARVSRGFSG